MIYRVPIEFEKGFEIERKPQNFDVKYSESEYNIITKSIEENFGFEVIPMEHYVDPICFGTDDLRFFDKYGNLITNSFGNNWGRYRLDGILTFDNYYKRFVIFQFRENFVISDSEFHIIDGVNHFSFSYNRLGIRYKNEYIKNSQEGDINTELTKLIVIYKNSQNSQLIEYFDSYSKYNKTIELWNFLKVDDFCLLNKVQVDDKEICWNNIDIEERDFFDLFEIGKETFYKYEIFKEYLKFNFTDINVYYRIDKEKVDKFIINLIVEDELSYEDNRHPYSHSYLDNRTQTISYLKKYLDNFIIQYNNISINKRKKIESINYLDFLYCYITVNSEEWNFKSNEKENFNFKYDLSFNSKQIIIKIDFEEGIVEENLGQLILVDSTSFSEINNYISSSFRVYKNEQELE